MPKAAIKKHLQLAISGDVSSWVFDMNNETIFQQNLPLFHFSGLLNSCNTLANGGKLLLAPKFSASGAIELMKKHRRTRDLKEMCHRLRYLNQIDSYD